MNIIIICFLFLFPLSVFAQTAAEMPAVSSGSAEAKEEAAVQPLPTEYRGIRLGMPIDSVKDALKKDSLFGYRGDRDISLLPTKNRTLIETAGSLFVARSWFQFYNENLYSMIFKLNTEAVDYYSVYSKFCEKYGEPTLINPQRSVWEDEYTRVVIERPLIVKYIDLTVFNILIQKGLMQETHSQIRRNDFIDSF